jgi:hypothetical protein
MHKRQKGRLLRSLAVAFLLSVVPTTAGCASWWQAITQNPAAAVSEFVAYVQGFIPTAQAIWALISPALGADSAQATADFNNSILTLENSLTALQDAVKAAIAAQQPNPDFTTLIQAVQDAVSKVIATIQAWQQKTKGITLGDNAALLQHQALQIANWRAGGK